MNKSVILTSPLKVMIPIIKVVGDFCNLRCWYCFYNARDQSTRRVMSDELLEKFIREYMEIFSGNLKFIWHGGEPLLAGLPFFQKILYFQAKYLKNNQTIRNVIQTNATLINNDWAKFFKEYDFKIGISLDGDKESHNRFRKNEDNLGSFNSAMRGIKILKNYGIRPGFIQTLTKINLENARENFSFFLNTLKAKSWGINYYLDIQELNRKMLGQNIDCAELTNFLKTCINFWLAQGNPDIRIREIENFLAGILNKQAASCTFNGSCTGYFTAEYNGKIFPCDRLSTDEKFLFGDLSKQPLLEILNSPQRLTYAQNVNTLHADCVMCEWKNACHNGCTANRINGVQGKYFYCETRKAIFSYLKEKIQKYK